MMYGTYLCSNGYHTKNHKIIFIFGNFTLLMNNVFNFTKSGKRNQKPMKGIMYTEQFLCTIPWHVCAINFGAIKIFASPVLKVEVECALFCGELFLDKILRKESFHAE